MNLAMGTLDRLRKPASTKATRTVEVKPQQIVSAFYAQAQAQGVYPEKEYWQLVDAYKSWVYTAIDKIAKSVAMIPLRLHTYRSKQSGKLIRDIQFKSVYRSLQTDDERKYFLKNQNLEKEEIFDHPFLQLINRPNPVMTRFTLWYNTIIRLELNGLGPWLKVRDGLRVPRQIYPLPLTKFASIRPKVASDMTIEYWRYQDGNILKQIPPEDIVPMLYPHPASPFQGMSPLMSQTYPYDIDLFLMQHQRSLFEKGANPGLVLTTEQQLVKEQVKELLELIEEKYAGSLKAGETMLLHSGLKPTAGTTFTGRELMIDRVAQDVRDRLITAHDLSPGKLGLVADVNRANMQGLDRIFIHECLRPKCMNMEEAIEVFLLPDYDRGLTCDFDLPSTEDEELELKKRDSRLENFLTTINEERQRDGMEPVEWGDRPWGSYTSTQIGLSPKPSPEPKPGKPPKAKALDLAFWTEERKDIYWKGVISRSEKLEEVFLAPMRRYFRGQREEILKRLDREGNKILGQYAGWSKQRIRQHLKDSKAVNLRTINIDKKKEQEALEDLFTPIMKVVMKEQGDETIDQLNMTVKGEVVVNAKAVTIEFNVNDPAVLKWLGSRMRMFSKEVTGTSFDEIESILKEGFANGDPVTTIAETLGAKFDSWDKYRAPLIARTETLAGMNRADYESVKQLGFDEKLVKHWLSARDSACRPTHTAADEAYSVKGIPIDKMFQVGEDQMLHPLGGSIANENINCRCIVIFSQAESESEET